MPVVNGVWVPTMFYKQTLVFNSIARALLVAGPRLSGKTRATLHRIARHLWETDGARVGMFVRTLKSSKDGGSWTLMIRSILPEWMRAGIGMRYTSETKGIFGPKTDGLTRTPFFRVTNRHGTESEMMLFSLDNDDDVEAKLKELEFSMIYFSELDKFGDRRVLTVALPSLRMGHLKFEQHMWISDCNPSEEGDASWIFQCFYRERTMGYPAYTAYQKQRGLPTLDESEYDSFYGQLQVIEILPHDNEFVDPRQLQEVKVACGADEGLYARHVLGKWVWGGGDASRHFRAIFKPFRHVIGNCEDNNPENWLCANPAAGSFEIITGWDLGDVNHAAVFIDKTYIDGVSVFTVVDEVVSTGEEVSIAAFTQMCLETLEALEKLAGKTYLTDRAWSDRNSMERYCALSDRYAYEEVLAESDSRFFLRGVGREAKARGSVRLRVALLKRLLHEDRLKISAHCKRTIQMFKDLKKGIALTDFVVSNEDKHVFDALSYALFMESAEDLENDAPRVGERRQSIVLSI